MSSPNATRDHGRDLPPNATRSEIAARMALVGAAKRRKYASCFDPDLTDAELDQVLPPVECLRTRRRLAQKGKR